MLPYPYRDFDRGVPLAGWTGSDRYDEQLDTMLSFLGGHDDDHGSLLASLLAAIFPLPVPEVDVGEDVSRPRGRP
jgi:hypothetical protein